MKFHARLLLLFCSVAPFAASLLYFLPENPTLWHQILYILTKSFTLAAPFLFWKKLGAPNWKNFLKVLDGTSPTKRRFTSLSPGVLRGMALGLAMGLVVEVAYRCLSLETQVSALIRIQQKITSMGISEHFWLYAILLSLAHSLLEEFYWRFFLFNAWKKFSSNKLLINLTSALSFALHHFVVAVFYFKDLGYLLGFGVMIGAIIWQFTYEKEKNLKAVWISHIVIDVVLMSFGFRALRLN